MNEKSTNELDNILSNARPNDYKSFIDSNNINPDISIDRYFNNYISDHHLILSDIIARCSISKDYAYQIINGTKSHPSRDKVLALCLACYMEVADTNRALKIAGLSPLYSKVNRDVAIIIMINNHVFSIAQINDFLESKGLDILCA